MKTALKLGICMLFVSLFNLGVVKADTLPFELKEPPSGTKLIFDTSSAIQSDMDSNGNLSNFSYKDGANSIMLYSLDIPYVLFYNEVDKTYTTTEYAEDLPELFRTKTTNNYKEALRYAKTNNEKFFITPELEDFYILFIDKTGVLKYSFKKDSIVNYLGSYKEYMLKQKKEYEEELKALNKSKIKAMQEKEQEIIVDYIVDFEKPGIEYSAESIKDYIYFSVKKDGSNAEYLQGITYTKESNFNKGRAIIDVPFINSGDYTVSMYRYGDLLASADISITTKEELDPDIEPNVTIDGIPDKKIPLGTEHKITIKTDIPCKIGVDHETTDKYITEYTFIVTKNEKDKYYMVIAENGRSKEGYLDIDFFDTTKVAEETKAEDKPLVVSSENKLAQTGKERNWYFILVPFLAIILVIGGRKWLKR